MDKYNQDAQNVIAMTDHQPEVSFAPIAQVEAYWEALRAARLVPRRAEVDPRGLEQALEHAFILERIAPGVARLRVAGSHLGQLLGMEVRGMPLTAFVSHGSRQVLADRLEDVCQIPASCHMRLSADAGPGRPGLEARLLLLPLKSDLGDISRVLGCWVTRGDLGLAPRRFEVVTHQLRPLTRLERPQRPAPAPGPQVGGRQPGFAAPQPPFEGKKKRPPYLRLIKSDD